VAKKITLRLAPGLESLAALEAEGKAGKYDFAFIDADKTGYDGYYEACLRLVRPGGLIAFDNMLQGGDVADRSIKRDGVKAVRALNAKLARDERVDVVLLPVGDGMTLVRRLK
jgi:predicted O-methyltransferase YrrM